MSLDPAQSSPVDPSRGARPVSRLGTLSLALSGSAAIALMPLCMGIFPDNVVIPVLNGAVGAAAIGCVLGIASMFRCGRNRPHAILGIVLGLAVVLAFLILLIIGNAMG